MNYFLNCILLFLVSGFSYWPSFLSVWTAVVNSSNFKLRCRRIRDTRENN